MIKPNVANILFFNAEKHGDCECEDAGDELEAAFLHLKQERVGRLRAGLHKTLLGRVMPLCAKVMELDPGTRLELPDTALASLTRQMIELGESEPCGVEGGCLVVTLPPSALSQKLVRVGRFQLGNNGLAPTFELHLQLQPSRRLRHKVANLVRRLQARPPAISLGDNYVITKKRLYRTTA